MATIKTKTFEEVSMDDGVKIEITNEESLVSSADGSVDNKGRSIAALADKVAYCLFSFFVFLLPLLFLPQFLGLNTEMSKLIFSSVMLLVVFVVWLLARLEDGLFILPKNLVSWSLLLILIVSFASSLSSDYIGQSFVGNLEMGTLVSLLFLLLSFYFGYYFYSNEKRLARLCFWIAASMSLAFIFQLLQIFTSWSFLGSSKIYNVVGKWNDFGILFGLGLLASTYALEFIDLTSSNKLFLKLFFAVSLLSVLVVNFSLLWIVIAVLSLVILLYSLVSSVIFLNPEGHQSTGIIKSVLSKPSFIALVIAVVSLFSSNYIGAQLSSYDIAQVEVRPSWGSTFIVAKNTISEKPILGVGLNRFWRQWILHKPIDVNQTMFWNTNFNVGVGRVPTYMSTSGILGVLGWLALLISLVYFGILSMFVRVDDPKEKQLLVLYAIAALYLWIMSVVYVPDVVLSVLTFVITGVWLAYMAKVGLVNSQRINSLSTPKTAFMGVLVSVLLLIASLAGGYFLYKKVMALVNFQQASYLINTTGDIDQAIGKIKKATQLAPSDAYYRSLVDLDLLKIRQILLNSKPTPELAAQFQDLLGQAVESAKNATDLDKTNYLNWLDLGLVGETVLPVKQIENAYILANDSYNKAATFYPNSPLILLRLARLEVANSDLEKAQEYLAKALEMKSNLTEAIFLLSQIEFTKGNLPGAIKQADQAAYFSPNDIGVLFQQGLLKYLDKDYQGSISSLEKAVVINPQYSNARYFLGLSYSYLGGRDNRQKALSQFEEIYKFNPDNREVKTIIENLKEGRGALEGSDNPAPEKRKKPPIEDDEE